jgi:hypothetical protein
MITINDIDIGHAYGYISYMLGMDKSTDILPKTSAFSTLSIIKVKDSKSVCDQKCNKQLQYYIHILFDHFIKDYIKIHKLKPTDIIFVWKGSMAMRSIYHKYKSIFNSKRTELNDIFDKFSDSDYSIFIKQTFSNTEYNKHLTYCIKLSRFILDVLRHHISFQITQCQGVHTLQDHVYQEMNGSYTIPYPIDCEYNHFVPLPISIHSLQSDKCNFNKQGILLKLQLTTCADKSGTKCINHTNFNELVDIVIRQQNDASLIEDYTDIDKIIKTYNYNYNRRFYNYNRRFYNYNRRFSFTTYSFDGYINDIIHILFKSHSELKDDPTPCIPFTLNKFEKNKVRLLFFIELKLYEIAYLLNHNKKDLNNINTTIPGKTDQENREKIAMELNKLTKSGTSHNINTVISIINNYIKYFISCIDTKSCENNPYNIHNKYFSSLNKFLEEYIKFIKDNETKYESQISNFTAYITKTLKQIGLTEITIKEFTKIYSNGNANSLSKYL